MISSVAPTRRTATTTVEANGLAVFLLEMYTDGESLQIESLRIGGVSHVHGFGTYAPPPLASCATVTLPGSAP
jgi:hypothetical protein